MNFKKTGHFWGLALLCIFVLSACGANQEAGRMAGENKSPEMENEKEEITKPVQAEASIHFTDDDGVVIDLDAPCEAIVSLYSAHTENLFALGAGDKVIGGHTTCIYPPEAAFLPVYDYNGDVEQVIAAAPDLVLIRPFIRSKVPDYVKQLEAAGILVVSLYPDSFEEFDDYIRKLSLLTGTEEAAEEKLAAFHGEIEEIKKLTQDVSEKKTVFLEATEVNIRTVTPDSMAGRAITYAGGVNLAADVKPSKEGSSIAEYGVEQVLAQGDKIDVYVSQRGAMNAGGNLASIGERPGYDTIRAVQEGSVYLINEKIISSPTFRYGKGVREMARFLYPELLDDLSAFESEEMITKETYAELVMKTLHLPLYLPGSSKYYQTEQKGHTFGLFADVSWEDACFDAVETAVYGGYVEWEKEGELEYFHPEAPVTREDLAKTVFLAGEFENRDSHVEIADLEDCEKPRLVQILVDNGIFSLEEGCFYPERKVSKKEALKALQKAAQSIN